MRLHRVLLWLALVILMTGNPIRPVAADITVGEAPAGSALWELNRDAAGTLYTSDYDLGMILAVNPTTGAYTRFEFDQTPERCQARCQRRALVERLSQRVRHDRPEQRPDHLLGPATSPSAVRPGS